MASKRKSPPTKLQDLVELVPLYDPAALIAGTKGLDTDRHGIPAKRNKRDDSDDVTPSSPTAPAVLNNNNSITNNNNNNNMTGKRSMDHVLKKLTFKMMRDEVEAVDHHTSGCPPEESSDEAAPIQLRERQLAAMLRQLQCQ
ncbi:hypothetical protein ONE63_002993 [Megalurothrips usitatus]|uniref:Uncharacterized protein n=1 Tax=Megalurothrips usitatus TaxID=439358 RepID=A0AAV7XCI9_9NEOP|nr:hypothetical protein ONE63_002993 [Megalurothrips usitatus]